MGVRDVWVRLRGKDDTGPALKSAEGRFQKLAVSAKSIFAALGAAFTAEKIARFLKDSVKAAADADTGIKESVDRISKRFEKMQVDVGKAILGDRGTVEFLEKLVDVTAKAAKFIAENLGAAFRGAQIVIVSFVAQLQVLAQTIKLVAGVIGEHIFAGGTLADRSKEMAAAARAEIALIKEAANATIAAIQAEKSVATGIDRESDDERKKRLAAQKMELEVLKLRIDAHKESAEDVQKLADLEAQLRTALDKKNIALERELELRQRLATVQGMRQGLTDRNLGVSTGLGTGTAGAGGTTNFGDPNLSPGGIPDILRGAGRGIGGEIADGAKGRESWEELAKTIGDGFGYALELGVTTAFDAFFTQGLDKGFAAFTEAILVAFGTMVQQFGVAALATSKLMLKLKASLASFSPLGGIAASLGLIALGSALKAAAHAAFGGSGERGGGGSTASNVSEQQSELGNNREDLVIYLPEEEYVQPSSPGMQRFYADLAGRARGRRIQIRKQ